VFLAVLKNSGSEGNTALEEGVVGVVVERDKRTADVESCGRGGGVEYESRE
jgi:hypothetical protein